MIKNYANKTSLSNSVSFIFKAASKRRKISLDKAKNVQLELGISPTLSAVK